MQDGPRGILPDVRPSGSERPGLPSVPEVEDQLTTIGFTKVRSYGPPGVREKAWFFERVSSDAVLHVRLYGPAEENVRVFRVIARNFSARPNHCQPDLVDLASLALGEANRPHIETWVDRHFGRAAVTHMASLRLTLEQATNEETRLTIE